VVEIDLRKDRGTVGRVGAVGMDPQKAVVDLAVVAAGPGREPSVGFV
jgi:hypothetical protein